MELEGHVDFTAKLSIEVLAHLFSFTEFLSLVALRRVSCSCYVSIPWRQIYIALYGVPAEETMWVFDATFPNAGYDVWKQMLMIRKQLMRKSSVRFELESNRNQTFQDLKWERGTGKYDITIPELNDLKTPGKQLSKFQIIERTIYEVASDYHSWKRFYENDGSYFDHGLIHGHECCHFMFGFFYHVNAMFETFILGSIQDESDRKQLLIERRNVKASAFIYHSQMLKDYHKAAPKRFLSNCYARIYLKTQISGQSQINEDSTTTREQPKTKTLAQQQEEFKNAMWDKKIKNSSSSPTFFPSPSKTPQQAMQDFLKGAPIDDMLRRAEEEVQKIWEAELPLKYKERYTQVLTRTVEQSATELPFIEKILLRCLDVCEEQQSDPSNNRDMNDIWGNAAMELAQLAEMLGKPAGFSEKWFDLAREKFMTIQETSPFRSYNLACLESVRGGDMELCRKYMNEVVAFFNRLTCIQGLEVTRIMQDQDLNNAKKEEWWADCMTSLLYHAIPRPRNMLGA